MQNQNDVIMMRTDAVCGLGELRRRSCYISEPVICCLIFVFFSFLFVHIVVAPPTAGILQQELIPVFVEMVIKF